MQTRSLLFSLGAIICLLFGTYHIISFVIPVTQLFGGETGNPEDLLSEDMIPDDPEDIEDGRDFILMYVYFMSYDYENYDKNDFPSWLYMPDTVNCSDDDDNSSSCDVQPFGGYDWANYNSNDFPSWLDMPNSLPENFSAEDFNPLDYMDEELLADVESEMENLEDLDESEMYLYLQYGVTEMPSDPFAFISMVVDWNDLIYSMIFFVVAIALIAFRY